MEPQMRYTRTRSGRSIAYTTMGSGQVLLALPPHLGMAIAGDLNVTANRRIAELTSRFFTNVRFDPHGCGLSDRDISDFSVESFVEDIEAVADAVSPEPFVLFANGTMTAPAIVYAARHPERLTHLLLWMVFAFRGDRGVLATRQMRDLALVDWTMATESGIRAVDNWEHDELASQLAALMRESVTPEAYVRFEDATETWDVGEYLSGIATPTLVIHPREHRYFPPATAQRVAATIPNARLALIESATVLFADARISAVAGEFLGTTPTRVARPRGEAPSPGALVVLFTDVAGSAALTEQLGDAAFRERSRALDGRVRQAVQHAGGRVIDARTLGDGVLATFRSAQQAIAAARSCVELSAACDLPLHIGLHAGDVIRDDDNVYGGAVNIAARICALSAPGEILISQTVRDLARTSAAATFDDRGEHTLKGIGDPVRVFAVQPAPSAQP